MSFALQLGDLAVAHAEPHLEPGHRRVLLGQGYPIAERPFECRQGLLDVAHLLVDTADVVLTERQQGEQPYGIRPLGLPFHDALAGIDDIVKRSQRGVVIESSVVRVSNRVNVFRQAPLKRELVWKTIDQVLLDGPSLLVDGQALIGLSDPGMDDADLDETVGEARSVRRASDGRRSASRSRIARD